MIRLARPWGHRCLLVNARANEQSALRQKSKPMLVEEEIIGVLVAREASSLRSASLTAAVSVCEVFGWLSKPVVAAPAGSVFSRGAPL
jgi:hypothetical protein